MPRSNLTVLAVTFAVSLGLVAIPVDSADAHVTPIDTSTSCPGTIPARGFGDMGAFDAETRRAVDCIAFYGITTGTTAITYSPTLSTFRRHMALFLIRQAKAHGITIPAATDQGFIDIGGLPQNERDAINQLAILGITKGTSATTFSPNGTVERWQMALFLKRLAEKAGVAFANDASHNQFTDLGTLSTEARAAIDSLADAHIALGVGGSLYDPFSPVSRWQMALFLTRVLAADGVTPFKGDFHFTPAGSVQLALGASQVFSVSGLTAGETYRIALIEGDEATIGSDGTAVFGDDEGAANQADNLGDQYTGEGAITAAGGTSIGSVKETTVIATSSGTTTLSVTSNGYEEFRVVLWDDDGNGELDLDAGNAPVEDFGMSGSISTAASQAPPGQTGSFTIVGVGSDSFTGSDGTNTFTFAFGTDDTYTYNSGTPITRTQFLSWLSTGDVVTVTNYSPTGVSTFDLTIDKLTAPSGLLAAVGDFDADAGTTASNDIRVSWTAASGGKVAGYTVSLYVDEGNVSTACSAGVSAVGPDVAGESATSYVMVDLAAGTYCGVVKATSGTGHTSTEASTTAVTVAAPATPSGPIIMSLALTIDDNSAGFFDAGDELTFDFDSAMSATLGSDSSTFLRIGDGDSTYQYECFTHLTMCSLADGPSTADANDRFVVRMSFVTPTLVSGSDNGVDLTSAATVVFVSDAWVSESGTPLDLAFSDVLID